MTTLRIYFHVRSPYSRLGLHAAARHGFEERAATRFCFFTGPSDGAAFLNPTDSKPKIRYMMEDAPRMTMRAGLPIAAPKAPEPDYTPAIRAFYAAREAGRALPFALAVSDAYWGHGKDISDPELFRQVASETGVPEGTDLLADNDAAAQEDRDWIERDGAFGVPFAAYDQGGKTHHFWGHERFELLAEMLG